MAVRCEVHVPLNYSPKDVVPVAGGWLLPPVLQAEIVDSGLPGAVIEIEIRTRAGRPPEVTALAVHWDLRLPVGITGALMRRLRIAEYVRLALLEGRQAAEHAGDGLLRRPGEVDVAYGGAVPSTPGRGHRLEDEVLEVAAAIYRAAVPTGRPVEQVREALNVSRSTAGRYLVEARRRGLLGPARPRVAGEIEPTASKAKRRKR